MRGLGGGAGGSHSHPSDKIGATGSGSCTFLLEANSVCFLHLVMGDIWFVQLSHGLRTPVI